MEKVKTNITYEILMVSLAEYKVFKLDSGFDEAEYTVKNNDAKWSCSCWAGHVYKYCKHQNWVRLVRNGEIKKLPLNVKIHKTISLETAKKAVLDILKDISQKKTGKYHENWQKKVIAK